MNNIIVHSTCRYQTTVGEQHNCHVYSQQIFNYMEGTNIAASVWVCNTQAV